MRHGRDHRKLGRTSAHRRAMLRNLVTSLLVAPGGAVRTTVEKAKEARRLADRLITLGKREGVHARRLAGRTLADRGVIKRLFDDLAPRFQGRNGGYTRVLRLGHRAGDGAEMAVLELVGIAEEARKLAAEARAQDKKKAATDKGAKEARPADDKAVKPGALRDRGRRLAKGAEKSKAGGQTKTQTKGGQRGA